MEHQRALVVQPCVAVSTRVQESDSTLYDERSNSSYFVGVKEVESECVGETHDTEHGDDWKTKSCVEYYSVECFTGFE